MENVGVGAEPASLIRTLVKNRTVSSIRLLVSRLWDASKQGIFSEEGGLDAIGIDSEGNAIHIVIERKHASYYRQILQEGCVYVFCNVGCVPAGYYRPLMRGERLRLNSGSKVIPDVSFTGHIKLYHFEFQTFAAAAARLDKDMMLTDLIGVVTRIDDPREGYTKHGEGTRTKFYIQDMDGNEFPVTLWGSHSLRFRACKLHENNQTTVIILCSMSIRKYAGEVYASSMSPTKFYINLDVPEVAEYLARFEAQHVVPEILLRNARSLENVTTESIQNKTLAELLAGPSSEIKIGQRYNCVATVIDFEVDHGWFYIACEKCTRKLPPPETNLGCQTCNLSPSDSKPWYRLEAIVEDGSGTASFTLFGRSGEKLIGATAAVLVSSPTMDPQCIHPLMERVIGNSRVFQVTLKENTFGDHGTKIVVQNIFDIPRDNCGNISQGFDVGITGGNSAESTNTSTLGGKRMFAAVDQPFGLEISSSPKKLQSSFTAKGVHINSNIDFTEGNNAMVGSAELPFCSLKSGHVNTVLRGNNARLEVNTPILESADLPLEALKSPHENVVCETNNASNTGNLFSGNAPSALLTEVLGSKDEDFKPSDDREDTRNKPPTKTASKECGVADLTRNHQFSDNSSDDDEDATLSVLRVRSSKKGGSKSNVGGNKKVDFIICREGTRKANDISWLRDTRI